MIVVTGKAPEEIIEVINSLPSECIEEKKAFSEENRRRAIRHVESVDVNLLERISTFSAPSM
jgi:hypothetical protein